MTAPEEQAGFERGRASIDRVRADRERAREARKVSGVNERRGAHEGRGAKKGRDANERETARTEVDSDDADLGPEHNSLTVADDRLDRPTESDVDRP